MPVAGALLVATAVSVLLRTGALQDGFWIDEGIAVGIASHDLHDRAVVGAAVAGDPRRRRRPGRRRMAGADRSRAAARARRGGRLHARWVATQVEPGWSARYLAVLYGPPAVTVACAVGRSAPVIAVGALALLALPLPAKSNVRAVAVSAGTGLRPGDVVVSTQPEQVPVLQRYLSPGVAYLTPLGVPSDPSVMDWRDALSRLRTASSPDLPALASGRRVVLVAPILRRARSPWHRAIRRRTREWRAALRADPRLRRLGATSRPDARRFRSTVRAEIYVVENEGRPTGRPPLLRPSVDPQLASGCRCCPGWARSTLSSRAQHGSGGRKPRPSPGSGNAMDRILDACSTMQDGVPALR